MKRMMAEDFKALTTPADLTETSFEWAVGMLRTADGDAPVTLIVRQSMAFQAGYVCGLWANEKQDVGVIVLPDELLRDADAWAVTDGFTTVWSPGA